VLGGRLGSEGVGFLSTGLVDDDVRWTDREVMKAKYAPQPGWGKQTRKLDIKFCNIRKVPLPPPPPALVHYCLSVLSQIPPQPFPALR